MKTLLTNGDSWTFGSEIMAPEFCTTSDEQGHGMAGRYKEGFHDHGYYNDYYRIPRIWPSYLGDLLNIPNIVNISKPARSNDTIYETTIAWILENYISRNKDTNDLLVVIGWSSPERKNIIISNSEDKTNSTSWLTLWPGMTETKYYVSPVIRDFFKFYVMHQWAEQEYIKRYVEQNYHLQNFCKLHNIEYYIFNAFYAVPGHGPERWIDINIIDTIDKWENLSNGWADDFYNWESIKTTLKYQWKEINPNKFIGKDSNSFRTHIFKNVEENIRMCNWHPSPASHKSWADYLSTQIKI